MNKKIILFISLFFFCLSPCFAYDETDYKTANSYFLDFDNEDVWADLDKTVLGKTGFEHAEDVINALDDAGYDYVILIREFKRTNSQHGPNAVEIRASIFREDELDKKNLYLALKKYTSYSQLRLYNGTKKINYYNMDFRFYKTSLSQSPSLEEQMKDLKKIYDDYSKGYWNVDQPARLLAEWSDVNFPNPHSGQYLIYYSNLNLKFDTSEFDKDLIVKINNRDYSVKNDEVSQSMLSYRNFKNGDINLKTDPKLKIELSKNNTEQVDGVDIIKSVELKLDYDYIDKDKYIYYYCTDGNNWFEYDGNDAVFVKTITSNSQVSIKFYNCELDYFSDVVSFNIDYIGYTTEYFDEFLKDKYVGEVENYDEFKLDDGLPGFINWYKHLIFKYFAFLPQIGDFIKKLNYDPYSNPYCVSASGASDLAEHTGHYILCPYIPKVELKFLGINQSYYVIDPVFWREHREQAFFWFKFLSSWSVLLAFINEGGKALGERN